MVDEKAARWGRSECCESEKMEMRKTKQKRKNRTQRQIINFGFWLGFDQQRRTNQDKIDVVSRVLCDALQPLNITEGMPPKFFRAHAAVGIDKEF